MRKTTETTKTTEMTAEQREAVRKARNAYVREWRKKNPEKVKKYWERYWLKKVQEQEQAN